MSVAAVILRVTADVTRIAARQGSVDAAEAALVQLLGDRSRAEALARTEGATLVDVDAFPIEGWSRLQHAGESTVVVRAVIEARVEISGIASDAECERVARRIAALDVRQAVADDISLADVDVVEVARTDRYREIDPATRRLVEWRQLRAIEARRAEAPTLVAGGIPDAWYDAPQFGCAEGHVSSSVVSSEERGDMCPTCRLPALILPPAERDGFGDTVSRLRGEVLPAA